MAGLGLDEAELKPDRANFELGIGKSGPKIGKSGTKLGKFGPEMAKLVPEVAMFGPEIADLGLEMVISTSHTHILPIPRTTIHRCTQGFLPV